MCLPRTSSRTISTAAALIILATMATPARPDAFVWVGNCDDVWTTCCKTTIDGKTYYINNWNTEPKQSECPPLPSFDDSVQVGSVIITAGAQADVLNADGTVLLENGTVYIKTAGIFSGSIQWWQGAIAGTGVVDINGGITMITPGTKTISGIQFNANAPVIWSDDGDIHLNNATYNNASTLSIVNNREMANMAVPTSYFNNAGGVVKAGDGITTIGTEYGVLFNNDGITEVQTGTLRLQGGGSSSGIFNILLAGALDFSGGHYLLGPGTRITGPGSMKITGGSVEVAEGVTVSPAAMFLSSGSLTGKGTAEITCLFDWQGGSLYDTGVTEAAGEASLSGSASKYLSYRTLRLAGAAVWTDTGRLNLEHDGTLSVLPSSVFTVQNDTSIETSTTGLIDVQGTLRKSAGTGTTTCAATFNNTGLVNVQSGTLRLNGSGTDAGQFNIGSGAFLEFGGGTHRFNIGTLFTGDGLVRVNGASLQIEEATVANARKVEMTSGTIKGKGLLRVADSFNWQGGSLYEAGLIEVVGGATFTLGGSATKYLTARTLSLAGQGSWTSTGKIHFDNGGTFSILPSGLFTVQNDSSAETNTTGVIDVQGTFRKAAGTGTTTCGVTFNNSGLVDVQSGTLKLTGGGTNTGRFDVAPDAFLEFAGGTHKSGSGASLTGGGLTQLSNATLQVEEAAVLNAANIRMTGGSIRGTGLLRIAGSFDWQAGSLSDGGTTEVAGEALFTLGGSAIKYLSGRTLNLAGQGAWTDTGKLHFDNGGSLSILPGGILTVLNDSTAETDTTGVIDVQGTLRKSAGTGSATCGVTLNNSGLVDVQSGTLKLTGSGTDTGRFNIAPNAFLEFGGGTHTLGSSASFTGDGTCRLNGGTLDLRNVPHASLGALDITAGILRGPGELEVGRTLTWTAGTIRDAGTLTVFDATVGGTGGKFLLQRTLSLTGQAAWTGGSISLQDGAALHVLGNGTLDIRSDSTVSQSGSGAAVSVTNAGMFLKSSGTGSTSFGTGVSMTNTGVVETRSGTLAFNGGYTQTAGETRLAGGNLVCTKPLSLLGGRLSGSGSIQGAVVNGGQIEPGSSVGTLAVVGGYTQNAAGSLVVEIGGPATCDQVTVSQTASLGGSVAVFLLDGFNPEPGSTFVILTCASRVGEFASLTGTAGKRFTIVYEANRVLLTALAPAPADSDGDGDVDSMDLARFAACTTGPAIPYDPANLPEECTLRADGDGFLPIDLDRDRDVDQTDFGGFQRCYNGEDVAVEPDCAS